MDDDSGWNSIETVPIGRDVEIRVRLRGEWYTVGFPCRRIEGGWVDARGRPFSGKPTHWREWRSKR